MVKKRKIQKTKNNDSPKLAEESLKIKQPLPVCSICAENVRNKD